MSAAAACACYRALATVAGAAKSEPNQNLARTGANRRLQVGGHRHAGRAAHTTTPKNYMLIMASDPGYWNSLVAKLKEADK